MDRGATKHMCTHSRISIKTGNQPYTAMKYFKKSIGTGKVILNTRLHKNEKNPMKLKDMLCVSDL